MKILRYTFSLLILLTALGCGSKEDAVAPEGTGTALAESFPAAVVGKWQLVGVQPTSMVAGKPAATQAPPYQETFDLRADSTFRRTRSNGYAATGKYTFVQYGPEDYGILATFDNPRLSYHELPGHPDKFRSYTEGQVYLRQTEPGVLVESYVASDGPSFIYRQQAVQD
ncbi:MAG: hypothetical protein ICV83_00820 [Cytophagales bacterium]|nr:hypothetical protein [Cytophagales bacterium]